MIVVFIIAGTYSYLLFDKAGDGRWYHQETIILIKNGWNPIFAPLNIDTLKDKFVFSKIYPISSELLSSSFAVLFHHIQIGKIINILFCLYCFCVSYISVNKLFKLSPSNTLIISLYIAFNPVVLSQVQSYYIDGNLFSAFIVLLFSTLMWLFHDSEKKFWIFGMLSSFSMLIGIKDTGLPFALIIFGIPTILYICNYRKFPKNILLVTIFLILAFIFFGWQPYIKNIIAGQNIFWPLAGHNHITVFFGMYNNGVEVNKIYLYLLSYLSPYPIEFGTKFLPSIKPFVTTDTQIGGLGPFFGLILIVTLYFTFKFLIINIKKFQTNTQAFIIFIIALVILITMAINPGSWWPRYTPGIILLPAIGIITLCNMNNSLWKKYQKLFIMMIVVNSGLFYCGSLILTSYRTYKFDKMENQCKSKQCIYDVKIFDTSLLNQLKEDNVNIKLGSCANKNIIWNDIIIQNQLTTVACFE